MQKAIHYSLSSVYALLYTLLYALLAAVILTSFTACGSNANSTTARQSDYMTSETAAETAIAPQSFSMKSNMAGAAGAAYDGSDVSYNMTKGTDEDIGTSSEQTEKSRKKLIYTYSINAETHDLEAEIERLNASVAKYNGYIEFSHASRPGKKDYYGSRSADYTIRIPIAHTDDFFRETESALNITDQSSSVEDITGSYMDTEARKTALQTEEKRLLEILEKAETVEDIISVESRLADVRYERESMELQLKNYDNRIDYATITLNIREVKDYTESPETVSERIISGFKESLEDVKNGSIDLFVWLVTHIPQIVILVIVFFVLRGIKRLFKGRLGFRLRKRKRGNSITPGGKSNDINDTMINNKNSVTTKGDDGVSIKGEDGIS